MKRIATGDDIGRGPIPSATATRASRGRHLDPQDQAPQRPVRQPGTRRRVRVRYARIATALAATL